VWDWVTEHWEFVVGTLIGVIGIVVAILTVWWQRSPKTLDYEVRSDIRLVHPQAGAHARTPSRNDSDRIRGVWAT
jgi:hypothetical protein